MSKYRMLRELLIQENVASFDAQPAAWALVEAPTVGIEEIQLAHDPTYCSQVFEGRLDERMQKRIGFAWSEALVMRSRVTVGGCLAAAREALRSGFSGNLAGGTHHAMRSAGEGYCVFNDQAVTARVLQTRGEARRIAVLDCDVHQGNGSADILGGNPDVLICDIFCSANFPFRKVLPQHAYPLAPGSGDQEYLAELDRALNAIRDFAPDILLYQMGVDGHEQDSLGKLKLSFDGLRERDRRVFDYARTQNVPVSLALGGGYSRPIDSTVRAYANTYRIAREYWA
jgi:acetoin utilization deacetylase AcuC-like enzyme